MPTSVRGRDPAVEEEFLGALYKGGELLASGKIVEAREHLEKAHGLAPKNEKAQNLLGLAYFKLGLFDQASEVYERLVNENPTDATLRVNLGLVYLKTNNLERCIKEFETATDLEPTHKKAHNYLGLALAQQGSYVKAKEHFELAGSDPMAEKMARAIAAQSAPSGLHSAVTRQAPVNVVIGGEPPPSAPRPKKTQEEAIEVMSDEELPVDAYVVPEEVTVSDQGQGASPSLSSDWGAQLAPAAETNVAEMRMAEDEGPPEEELPVLEAVVEPPAGAEAVSQTPSWLTMEANEASRVDAATAQTGWVTESVSEVPLPAEPEQQPAAEVPLDATDARWDQSAAPPAEALAQPETATEWVTQVAPPAEEAPPAAAPDEAAPAAEQAPLPSAPDDASWATGTPANADEASWATAPAAEAPPAQDASWATAPAENASWAAAEAAPATTDESSWATAPGVETAPQEDASWAPAPAAETPATTDEASWATAPAAETPAATDEASWATAPTAETPAVTDEASWATAPAAETPAAADEASWPTAPAAAAATDDASWATAAQTAPATTDEASWATAPAAEAPLPTTPDDESWAVAAAPAQNVAVEPEPQWATQEVESISASAAQAALDLPPTPEPSAPISITVEEPQEAPRPLAAPAGYAPMSPQRLVDLGASGSWVREPGAGPFHISTDGLAVTVAGEMMVRMTGLVAIAGSVQATPEFKRRRGRPSPEPFGTGTSQLQRVTGNGVLYLEPGRSKFHAVDLTDQNGVAIDDDGAYLREEMVFAFEEAIFFENGRLTAEGQTLDLAHLKGNGRVLLQLEGSLRAMPIPLGAPMVVPLHRVVGWFGRVSPRLMGFGGRGAVELTGEGYALLGTPAETR